MNAIGRLIKRDFLLFMMPEKHRKTAMDERRKPAAAGAESILLLLNVSEKDALTLQMLQLRSKKALLW